MNNPNNLILSLASTPLVRKEGGISEEIIVFTNDGKDDITTQPQAYPPVEMQIILCNDTKARNYARLLRDLWEYEDNNPYIHDNLSEIAAGTDPNWVITDVQIDSDYHVNLGVMAKKQEDNCPDFVNLHLNANIGNFTAIFRCQHRALSIQRFTAHNTQHSFDCAAIVHRIKNDQITEIAVSIYRNRWEVTRPSELPS